MKLIASLRSTLRILMKLAQRGASEPMKVLAAVIALADAGGKIGRVELEGVKKAIRTAVDLGVANQADQDQLDTTLAEVEAVLIADDTNSAMTYGGTATPVEGAEGLEWDARLIKSGRSVDGRYFFPPETLEASVALFEGVQCFADHAPEGQNQSVKDLVGWFTDPHIVQLEDGVVAVDATLHVLENSGYKGVLVEMAQRGAPKPLGLSIDADGDVTLMAGETGEHYLHIDQINSVFSVDLVTRPAAGGEVVGLRQAVLAAVLALPKLPSLRAASTPTAQASDPDNVAQAQQVLDEAKRLRAEMERERAASLIASELGNANFPPAIERMVRERLNGIVDANQIRQIMAEFRNMWAISLEMNNQHRVVGSGIQVTGQPSRKILRIQSMLAKKALDGVEPYRGLREAYSDVTGRDAFRMAPQQFATEVIRGAWGYDSANTRILATIDDSDWPYALGQALHREVIRQYNLPGFDDWRKIVSNVSNLNDMRTVTRTRTGYFDVLPVVAKGGTYQPLTDPTEEVVQYAPSKYGATSDYLWESALNDDLNELIAIPKKLALSAKVTVWYTILNIIAAATPPNCDYDSVALFHATHSNLGSTTLSTTTWSATRVAMMTQTVPDASTISLGTTPKYLIIPPDLEEAALKLLTSDTDPGGGTSNPIGNPWKGTFEIIIIPFWSDADAFAACADPALVPTIEVGFLGGKEEPELATEAENSGSNFTADKITYRVRHVFGYDILDHRGMYKAVP